MNKFWFKPKTFGYGATPSSWEGWAVTVIFVLLIFVIVEMFLLDKTVEFFVALIVLTVLLIILTKKKTEGKWHWSWGRK